MSPEQKPLEFDLRPPIYHPAPPTTLGYVAVTAEEQRVESILGIPEDGLEAWESQYTSGPTPQDIEQVQALGKVRDILGALSPQQREIFEEYMKHNAPASLRGAKDVDPETEAAKQMKSVPGHIGKNGRPSFKDETWVEWLIYGANNRELTNVMQWHVAMLDKQNEGEEIQEKLEAARLLYKQDIEKGVAEEWLSESALDAITLVDGLKVHFGDIFDTTLQGVAGYWWQGDDHVTLEQGTDTNFSFTGGTSQKIDEHYSHEANHALLSSLPETEDGTFPEPYYLIAERWWQEGMTEHIAQVFDHGDLEATNPKDRFGDEGVYEFERLMHGAVLTGGNKHVSVALATRAYSGTEKEIEEYLQAVDESWGFEGALVKINFRIRTEEGIGVMRDDLSERQAQNKALERVRTWLLQEPQKIFGESYVKPKSGALLQAARIK